MGNVRKKENVFNSISFECYLASTARPILVNSIPKDASEKESLLNLPVVGEFVKISFCRPNIYDCKLVN